MVEALARLLDLLHSAGYAHRDVKARSRTRYLGRSCVNTMLHPRQMHVGLSNLHVYVPNST